MADGSAKVTEGAARADQAGAAWSRSCSCCRVGDDDAAVGRDRDADALRTRLWLAG
jgi:hypothetical protein